MFQLEKLPPYGQALKLSYFWEPGSQAKQGKIKFILYIGWQSAQYFLISAVVQLMVSGLGSAKNNSLLGFEEHFET